MNQDEKDKKSDKQNIYKEIAPHLNLGLQLATTIGVCIILGWWLDKKFDLSPILTLFLLFLVFLLVFLIFLEI